MYNLKTQENKYVHAWLTIVSLKTLLKLKNTKDKKWDKKNESYKD